MKLQNCLTLAFGLTACPGTLAWGSFGHITVAYIAGDFITDQSRSYLQGLLRDESSDYLASVATWADSVRYTHWGKFTKNFHFIDAKDNPPEYCGVDLDRDCKADGCVVTSLQNYTTRLLDQELPAWERAQAAKFVIHFVGDLHQPLHNENVARGGNGIRVLFDGYKSNLHHVWDTSIAEKFRGGVPRKPYRAARAWAKDLTADIQDGKFALDRDDWLRAADLSDPITAGLTWSRETNAFICSHVLPQGPEKIKNQELGGEYYEKAAPVIEAQVARAGYRLAAWLDQIVTNVTQTSIDEL